MIKRLKDIQGEIDSVVSKPFQRGNQTGFKCLDKLYTIKPGSFTIIQGSPAHGKSEFIFELLMNLSDKYGHRHFVCSPETGSVAEIMIELAHKYMRKPIVKHPHNEQVCSPKEIAQALEWVDHNFRIVDADENGYSYEELCDACLKDERDSGLKINNIMAEPYNELKHDMAGFGTRQDLYIEEFITNVRRFSKKNNKHTFLSFHPGSQSLVNVKDSGLSYYPMPKAREAAGGQATLRKAMTWINIWRPPANFKDPHGLPYKDNQVLINIEKAKPKYYSYKGTTSLYFDYLQNRYYEEIEMLNYVAFAHEKIGEPEELPF